VSSLRILSWNTQLRSWGMEMGFPPTIPPVTTAEERAFFIADKILASPSDYDIVGLCEVFDEEARLILRHKLRHRFPWIITKSDFGFIGTELGTPSLIDLPLQGMSFISGLVFNPLSILDYRPEDSGLMLFSRWPFATRGLVSLPPDVVALLQSGPLGSGIPTQVPLVNFLPFSSTTGNDKFAAKGVLYARIDRDPWHTYHVFFSHTQADEERPEENAAERGQQMVEIEKFVEGSLGDVPVAHEVFLMGDLNIRGELSSDADTQREWAGTFRTPGRLLTEFLVDLWGRRQCTGKRGLRDSGFTASVSYEPQEQRLDYIVGSTDSQLAAQHILIDHHLATVPPGHPGVSFLSDHLPLRLELAAPRPFSTPQGAMRVPPSVMFTDDQWLFDGQVVWYRYDKAGTYDFELITDGPCDFEVYLDTDMSRPRRQYRSEVTLEFGKKFVLASAPFLVKVFPLTRGSESYFRFSSRLHQGIAPWDAIQLPYGVPVAEGFPRPVPSPQLFNPDLQETPWDDKDTKWFRLDAPAVPLDWPLELAIVVQAMAGSAPFGVRLAAESGGSWSEVESVGPGKNRYELKAEIEHGEQLYVCVFRDDEPNFRRRDFVVTAKAGLSLLIGGARGRPRLVCVKETLGWGADDIELDITVDGAGLRYITNGEIGDMEKDSVRDLDQWIPDLVPYRSGVGFRVIELDAIDPNDIGSATLLPVQQLMQAGGAFRGQKDPDGSVRGSLRVNVDSGRYDVQLKVTSWDEQF
jgi:endonuclease/exonuclease/phosphatase family metal-dependent hydrolase